MWHVRSRLGACGSAPLNWVGVMLGYGWESCPTRGGSQARLWVGVMPSYGWESCPAMGGSHARLVG